MSEHPVDGDSAKAASAIDRHALVDRHRVSQTELDPRSPLSVGNGEFCFTADLTGLQTFPDAYPVGPRDQDRPDGTLLGTYAQWGWHSEPVDPVPSIAQALVGYDSGHGVVPYVDMTGSISGGTEDGTPAAEIWLRANPHRLHLGQLGFLDDTNSAERAGGHGRPRAVSSTEIGDTDQQLDLWTGLLSSRFSWHDHPVAVRTVCDPRLDRLAVEIDSVGLTNAPPPTLRTSGTAVPRWICRQ